MAHRGELLEQAADKLKEASGLDSVLEKADSSALGSFLPVTVGSVQSLAQPRRLARFPHDYFQDIIVDEAHHCLSDSYKRVLSHFPDANILGVTATPDRGDMKNLGEYFDSKAYEYSMTDAIIRFKHFSNKIYYTLWSIEFSLTFTFGKSKLTEKIFIYTTYNVVLFIVCVDTIDFIKQRSQLCCIKVQA